MFSTTEKYYYYVNYEYENKQYKTSLYEYSDKMSGRTVELLIKKNAPDDAKKKSNLDNPGADFAMFFFLGLSTFSLAATIVTFVKDEKCKSEHYG